jgi:O-antigen/teichoic acid export membrane protein
MHVDRQNGRGLIAKNSIINLLGQILPMLASVLTIPYVVKGIGTDGYGILSIAFLVLGYFSIFDLGLSRATVKFVAEHLSPDKIHKVPGLVWTSLTLLVGLGCVFGTIGAIFVPMMMTRFFKMPPSFIGDARLSILILCLAMPIMLGTDALRGVLEAAQRFDLVNFVKVPASVMFSLSSALAIPLGIGVPGIVSMLVAIRLTTLVVYLFMCFRVFPGLKGSFQFSREALKPLTVFGGWIMVSNVTGPIFAYLERFMIASLLSVSMLTFYSVPFDLVGKILIFPMSIIPSLFPYFSYHGTKGRNEVSEVTSRVAKYMLLILTPVVAVFFCFARQILQLWLGSDFANQSTIVLQLVAVLFFVNAFAMLPYTSVQALGRPDLKAILDLVVLPVYAVSAWWLMRRAGVNGAALAKLFVTIVDFSALYIIASRLRAFSIRDWFAGPLMRALALSAGLVALVGLIASLHARIGVSIALLIVSFLVYAFLFWIFAVDEEDRLVIRNLWSQVVSFRKAKSMTAAIPVLESESDIRG